MEQECIFCKIVAGQLNAVKVFEDELTLAIMDIYPASDGHTLIISKHHYKNLFNIPTDTLQAVAASSQSVGRAIMRALKPSGMRVMQFNGQAAGQTVFHYHVHLRPAYSGQHLRSHGRTMAELDHIKDLATKIRSELGN